MRSTLTLPEMPETAVVREAKSLCQSIGEDDPALINWTIGLINDRDLWYNTKRKGR